MNISHTFRIPSSIGIVSTDAPTTGYLYLPRFFSVSIARFLAQGGSIRRGLQTNTRKRKD